MKTCRDCLHLDMTSISWECRAPQNTERWTNPVSGDEVHSYRGRLCSEQREFGWFWARARQMCGKEGRWFVPNELAEANTATHLTKNAVLETLNEVTKAQSGRFR